MGLHSDGHGAKEAFHALSTNSFGQVRESLDKRKKDVLNYELLIVGAQLQKEMVFLNGSEVMGNVASVGVDKFLDHLTIGILKYDIALLCIVFSDREPVVHLSLFFHDNRRVRNCQQPHDGFESRNIITEEHDRGNENQNHEQLVGGIAHIQGVAIACRS